LWAGPHRGRRSKRAGSAIRICLGEGLAIWANVWGQANDRGPDTAGHVLDSPHARDLRRVDGLRCRLGAHIVDIRRHRVSDLRELPLSRFCVRQQLGLQGLWRIAGDLERWLFAALVIVNRLEGPPESNHRSGGIGRWTLETLPRAHQGLTKR
jgi:hypothetical protein